MSDPEWRRASDLFARSASILFITGPVLGAVRSGVPTMEINPDSSAVSEDVEVRIRAGAAVALERIWAPERLGSAPSSPSLWRARRR